MPRRVEDFQALGGDQRLHRLGRVAAGRLGPPGVTQAHRQVDGGGLIADRGVKLMDGQADIVLLKRALG